VVEQVEEGCEEEGAAALRCAEFDEDVRPGLVQDLLIDPEIEGQLLDRYSEPVRVLPNPRVVIQLVERLADARLRHP
jgi:hypothetical protein